MSGVVYRGDFMSGVSGGCQEWCIGVMSGVVYRGDVRSGVSG